MVELTAADAFGRCRPELRRHGVSGGLHNRHASAANKALFLRLLHTAIPQVEFIKDSRR
ncbi:hypothetical protein M8494_15615 [Serratia ureilytica]